MKIALALSVKSLDSESYQLRMSDRIISRKLFDEGFRLENVARDGNCFFSSVSIVLNHRSFRERNNWTQAELRELGVNYLRANPKMFPVEDEMEPYIQ
jgi:hypothetical protein